jgi:Icc-related predicted phosphoesterase
MKIQVISDLHFEFGSHYLLHQLKQCDSDVVVIAGDLDTSKGIISSLNHVHSELNKHIVFVCGNHEYYYSTKQNIDDALYNRFNHHKYIHVLNNDVWEHEGVIFVGSTGWWTMNEARNVVHLMSDFTLIHDLMPANYGLDWGNESLIFFNKTLLKIGTGKKVVCVSHNAPSTQSIGGDYKNDVLNPCFVNCWEYVMMDYKPNIWIHGHVHQSKEYKVDDTLVVCNPFGYDARITNVKFDTQKVVEI